MPDNQITIEEAIIKVFKNNSSKHLSMQDIRNEFQKIYKISDFQKENDFKYPQPRWHHEIRSITSKLVNRGMVTRVSRNKYLFIKN